MPRRCDMGAKGTKYWSGFYLIYPAFYTDTTESYRLGRWGRVRTDLGGFYFHLLFAVGLVAAYLRSGYDILLLAILLINLDMARQLIPFVRLDGYWLLSDLTGIPDLFTQMGSFIRECRVALAPRGTSGCQPQAMGGEGVRHLSTGHDSVLTFLTVFFIIRVPVLVESILHSLSLKFDVVV